jgi:hypothetical protein
VVEESAAADPDTPDPRIDAYCEYFRRQLAEIGDVDDALRELGCSERGER